MRMAGIAGMAACGCGVLRCVGRGHGPLLLGNGGVRVRGRERLVLMRMAGIAGMARSYSGMAACGCGVLVAGMARSYAADRAIRSISCSYATDRVGARHARDLRGT